MQRPHLFLADLHRGSNNEVTLWWEWMVGFRPGEAPALHVAEALKEPQTREGESHNHERGMS